MTEALRRVVIEAEPPESLADEVEQALQSGDRASIDRSIKGAMDTWSYDRCKDADPERSQDDVTEVQRRIVEAEADPAVCVPIEEVRSKMLAKFGNPRP